MEKIYPKPKFQDGSLNCLFLIPYLSQLLLLGLLAKTTLLYRFVRIDDAMRVAFVSDTRSWSAGRIPLSATGLV